MGYYTELYIELELADAAKVQELKKIEEERDNFKDLYLSVKKNWCE